MKAGKSIIAGLLIVSGMIMLSAEKASAYIDPGTGSMIIQAVIAAIAAVGVALAAFRERVVAFLARIFGRKGEK